MAKEWSVSEFKRNPEITPEERGEIDLHSPDAVDAVNNLVGTPIGVAIPAPQQELAPIQGVTEMAPPAPGVPRILIAVPLLEVTFKFFESWHKFWTSCMTTVNGRFEIGPAFLYRKPVHLAETEAVNIAKYNGCTHILFMDDDIYDVTVEMIDKLLAADKDVIAGVMYASGFPYSQCTFRRFDTETTVASQPAQRGMYRLYEVPCICPHCMAEGHHTDFGGNWELDFCPICRKEIKDLAVQKVDLVPFCFTLMKMSVFDRIRTPWFHCNTVFPTDSWFADRCIEAGIQQYAHMTVRLNHRDVNDITRPHLYQKDLALNRTKKQVIGMPPEIMERHEQMVSDRLFEAEKAFRYQDKAEFVSVQNGQVSNIKPQEVQHDQAQETINHHDQPSGQLPPT